MAVIKNLKARAIKSILTGRSNRGTCPICEKRTLFIELDEWLRDYYVCIYCRSIPRNRAIIFVLEKFFPRYRTMKIHESSPCGPASDKLRKECLNYTPTHFYPDVRPGDYKNGIRCEDLEEMTFEDNSFDLMITQDVLEHILTPDRAFKEIARILKPGGAHVFTVPVYDREKTLIRAVETPKGIEYPEEKQYHGNPIDEKGSLVTREWGKDIVRYIKEKSGLDTTVHRIVDRNLGLNGEFLEVFVSEKQRT